MNILHYMLSIKHKLHGGTETVYFRSRYESVGKNSAIEWTHRVNDSTICRILITTNKTTTSNKTKGTWMYIHT